MCPPGPASCAALLSRGIYRTDDRALNPGDNGVIVTIEIPDDEACDFLGPGQPITLWHGSDIDHGIISRRVFFTSVP